MIRRLKKKFRELLFKEELMQDWVIDLDLIKQSSLMSIIRGTDGYNGTNKKLKDITKMLRYLIVNDAKKKKSYMSDVVVKRNEVMKTLKTEYFKNKHWVEHIVGAGFNIKNNHPNNYVREYWGNVSATMSAYMKDFELREKRKIVKKERAELMYKLVMGNFIKFE